MLDNIAKVNKTERKQILAIDKRDGKQVMIWEDRFDAKYWELPESASESTLNTKFICEEHKKEFKTGAALKAHHTRYHKAI